MTLGNLHEIIGTIAKVKEEGHEVKVVFSIEKKISIPKDKIDTAKLKTLLGEPVGIMNLEDNYKIRKVK